MIQVFKTSVRSKLQASRLKPHIDQLLPGAKWNFDLADCDKILRIDYAKNVAREIAILLKEHRHHCEELE